MIKFLYILYSIFKLTSAVEKTKTHQISNYINNAAVDIKVIQVYFFTNTYYFE